jgi:hypothetical protein
VVVQKAPIKKLNRILKSKHLIKLYSCTGLQDYALHLLIKSTVHTGESAFHATAVLRQRKNAVIQGINQTDFDDVKEEKRNFTFT